MLWLDETNLHVQLQNVHLRLHEGAEVGLRPAEVSVHELFNVAVWPLVKVALTCSMFSDW